MHTNQRSCETADRSAPDGRAHEVPAGDEEDRLPAMLFLAKGPVRSGGSAAAGGTGRRGFRCGKGFQSAAMCIGGSAVYRSWAALIHVQSIQKKQCP